MGDDDIRRLYDKMEDLVKGQVQIVTNQANQHALLSEVRQDVKRLQSEGCARGEDDRRRIDHLEKIPRGNGYTNGTPDRADVKRGVFQGPVAMLVALAVVILSGVAVIVQLLVK